MNGYSNLTSSPAIMASRGTGRLELPGAMEANAWEWPAIGAGTLARNLSSASQRFRAMERSKNGLHGLHGAVRRVFSMRRQPSGLAEEYWRIHDMDGDGEVEEQMGGATSKNGSKTKRSNILKACRRLLGF